MVDNVDITPGTGATVAADDLAGVLHQRVKISLGADGAATDALGGAGAVAAGVQRVTLASDDPGVGLLTTIDGDTSTLAAVDFATESGGNLATISTRLNNALIGEYETVAASQTDQALGATGGTGDYLAGLLIVPATVDAGAVSIKDGAGSAITIFTGGTGSVTNLVPFFVPLGITSAAGAWKVTTGASVSCIGVGNFT